MYRDGPSFVVNLFLFFYVHDDDDDDDDIELNFLLNDFQFPLGLERPPPSVAVNSNYRECEAQLRSLVRQVSFLVLGSGSPHGRHTWRQCHSYV